MCKCNCFEDNLKRIKDHLIEKLGENAKELSVNWQDYSFFIDGGDHIPVNPKVKYEYRGIRKDGSLKANKNKDTITLMAQYCPFCGRDTKATEQTKDAA